MNAHLSEDDLKVLKEEIPLGRLGTPEDVAKAVLFFIDGSDYITGQTLCVDGGFIV